MPRGRSQHEPTDPIRPAAELHDPQSRTTDPPLSSVTTGSSGSVWAAGPILPRRSVTHHLPGILPGVTRFRISDPGWASTIDGVGEPAATTLVNQGNAVDPLLEAMEGIVEDLYGHVHRVSTVATAIGRTMSLRAPLLDGLHTVGVLHDVGKVHIDPTILAKPGPLGAEEQAAMRRHPELGFAMTAEILEAGVAKAILHHHERWDGLGYPDGLSGEDIPLLSRIVFVADAFDAITSHRSYQPALPVDYAVGEIVGNSGRQFDPTIVEAFLAVVGDLPTTAPSTIA